MSALKQPKKLSKKLKNNLAINWAKSFYDKHENKTKKEFEKWLYK